MIALNNRKNYRLEIKVRNARLLRAMHARGFETAAALSVASGVSQTEIGRFLSLKRTPYVNDQLRPGALAIALTLGRPVEELWPPQHLDTPLSKSSTSMDLDLSDIRAIAADFDVEKIVEARLSVRRLLTQLSPKHRDLLQRRYGIDRPAETLEDIARDYRVTRERVRQMQCCAERRLSRIEADAEVTDRAE